MDHRYTFGLRISQVTNRLQRKESNYELNEIIVEHLDSNLFIIYLFLFFFIIIFFLPFEI